MAGTEGETAPAVVQDLVASFTPIARKHGWDEPRVALGKCSVIANAVALHARAMGLRVSFTRFTDPEQVDAVDQQQNVVILGGWVIDFYGHDPEDSHNRPGDCWPLVERVEAFSSRYPSRAEVCPRCGSSPNRFHPEALGRCDGPYTPDQAERRLLPLISGDLQHLFAH